MEITWHAHHAVISDRLRRKAEVALERLGKRLDRVVSATVRFEREETRCRVELLLTAPRRRPIVAEGHGRYYGPALALALTHLERQVSAERRTARDRVRAAVRR